MNTLHHLPAESGLLSRHGRSAGQQTPAPLREALDEAIRSREPTALPAPHALVVLWVPHEPGPAA